MTHFNLRKDYPMIFEYHVTSCRQSREIYVHVPEQDAEPVF